MIFSSSSFRLESVRECVQIVCCEHRTLIDFGFESKIKGKENHRGKIQKERKTALGSVALVMICARAVYKCYFEYIRKKGIRCVYKVQTAPRWTQLMIMFLLCCLFWVEYKEKSGKKRPRNQCSMLEMIVVILFCFFYRLNGFSAKYCCKLNVCIKTMKKTTWTIINRNKIKTNKTEIQKEIHLTEWH